MKGIHNISKSKQVGTILLGVIVAIVMGIGQGSYFNSEVATCKVEENANNEDDGATEEVLIVQAVNAIATTVQLHVAHTLYFISETIFSDSPKITTDYFENLHLDTYLNFIFRQIISPNAP